MPDVVARASDGHFRLLAREDGGGNAGGGQGWNARNKVGTTDVLQTASGNFVLSWVSKGAGASHILVLTDVKGWVIWVITC